MDDGYNGNTFDRPALNKLVSAIENGEIDAVIVTEILRLGHNNIYSEYPCFIELYIIGNDIRIISLTDGIDSKDVNNKVLLKAQNRLNEINGLIKIEFERLVFGNLSDEEFVSVISKYETEQKELSILIAKQKQLGQGGQSHEQQGKFSHVHD